MSVSSRSMRSRSSSIESFGSVNFHWPDSHRPIRDAVAHLLLTDSLLTVRCSAEQLITPLNSIGDATGREDVMLVDKEMIGMAFSNCGKEFCAPYEEMQIEEGGEAVLICRVGQRVGSAREGNRRMVTDFGVFANDIDAAVQDLKLSGSDSSPPHPLDNWGKIRREMKIPNKVKQELHQFLKDKMTAKKRKEKSKSKGKSKRMRSPVKSAKKGSDGMKKPSNPKAARNPPSEVSPTPRSPTKPADPKKARVELPDMEELQGKYWLLMGQLKHVHGQILEREALDKESRGGEAAPVAEDPAQDDADDVITLYYIRKARAGKLSLSGDFIITDDMLKEGLVPMTGNKGDEIFDKKRSWTTYKVVETGHSASWAPATHEVKHLNRKAEAEWEHDIMKKLKKLFSGDISTWSYEAQRIMIACSLFGYGCSDEATIMIMAGTAKALFYELGIEVTDAQIAKAFPSRATLANLEPKVAADCLLSICQEIKEDFERDPGVRLQQLDLGLTCDHGHRQDQDHFVKLISWAGFDENNNWTIKFYCVDVVS